MAIQAVIDHTEWVSQAGNPVAYAPHLRAAPLDGVPVKAVIVQFARGDQTVPNPTATAILRAGDLAAQATYFRADLEVAAAVAATAGQPPAVAAALVNPLKNPHTFLTNIGHPYGRPFALAAQAQIATFFASDGALVIDPDPIGPFDPGPTFVSPVGIVDPPPFPAVSAFEVPIVPPLPETLNFIP
jgi:hypothetical protein